MIHNAISHNLFRMINGLSCFYWRRSAPQSVDCSMKLEPEELDQARELLRRILFENILPFWYPRVIDTEGGGYRLNHDIQGIWKGPAGKSLVAQARTLWFFSRIARSPYGGDKYREAAEHGYRFLVDKLWDREFGGFYWETDSGGKKPNKTHKLLYGQAFGLYALSEYGNACGDESAVALASSLFRILQKYAHDPKSGGYREFFLETWESPAPDAIGYLSIPHGVKSMNAHMHLMEAVSNYLRVTGDPDAKESLIELIFVLSSAVVRKTAGACRDAHMHDWSPFCPDGNGNLPQWSPLRNHELSRVSYGHDIQNVGLLINACDTLGMSNFPFMDLYQTLFHYCFRYGFDTKRGGFYRSGPVQSRADRREKIWWIQAEALLGTLSLYRLSTKRAHWDCFRKTLDWIHDYQIDWIHGEWHAEIDTRGTSSGDKAGEWKCPYHNGRAVLHCLEILDSMTSTRSQPSVVIKGTGKRQDAALGGELL